VIDFLEFKAFTAGMMPQPQGLQPQPVKRCHPQCVPAAAAPKPSMTRLEPPTQRRKLRANPTENCEPEYGIPQSVSLRQKREVRESPKLVEDQSEPSEKHGKIPVHDTPRALPAHPTPRAYALTRLGRFTRLGGPEAPRI
jgi:hypothetical protein